jgi:pantothenate kinase-related protein Tda10
LGRGVAGTHDINLGYEAINNMTMCRDASKSVLIP